MSIRTISIVLALAGFSSRLVAQRVIYDPSKGEAQLDDYILQCYKSGQNQAAAGIEENKALETTQAQTQIGGARAPEMAPAGAADATAETSLTSPVVTKDPVLQNYITWTAQRRVAHAAMCAQLNALIGENNGKPLDWASQVSVATRLKILANDRLALSTLEANAVAEARVELKMKVSDHYRKELEEKRSAELAQALAAQNER